jgi:hypothetical protein
MIKLSGEPSGGSLWAAIRVAAGAEPDVLEWFAQPFLIVALVVLPVSFRDHGTPRGIPCSSVVSS